MTSHPFGPKFKPCVPVSCPPDDPKPVPRPIPGCRWIDPGDGTCGHPDAMTPECWRIGDDRCDCPPLDAHG